MEFSLIIYLIVIPNILYLFVELYYKIYTSRKLYKYNKYLHLINNIHKYIKSVLAYYAHITIYLSIAVQLSLFSL